MDYYCPLVSVELYGHDSGIILYESWRIKYIYNMSIQVYEYTGMSIQVYEYMRINNSPE